MKRVVAAIMGAMILTIAACSSSSPPETGEIKKLEGNRIPAGAGPDQGDVPIEKK